MNEFVDFWVVLAKPSLYDDLRGYGAVGLPRRRYPAPGILARLGLAVARLRSA